MNEIVEMALPSRLRQQTLTMVADGWFRDESDLIEEALRRFLESHRADLMEHFILQDVDWAFHGGD